MARSATAVQVYPRVRLYQALRRASLLASLAFTIGVPVFALLSNVSENGGVSDSPWTGLVRGLAPARRLPITGAPWSIGLYGIEILDPLAALGLLVTGSTSLSFWISTLPALVLVLLLGRYFCGWLCPYALLVGASNAARAIAKKLRIPVLDVRLDDRWAYGVLAVLLLVTLLSGQQVASLVYPPAVIGRALGKVVLFGTAGAGAAFIGVLFLFDTFVSRAGFCRSFCPGGAVFRAIGARSPIRVERDAPHCTSCTACDVVCNFGQSPMTDRLDSACERCGMCVAACPTGALDLVLIAKRPRRDAP